MYRRDDRAGNPGDPLVTWRDHHSGEGHMMYAEDSYSFSGHVKILEKHGGMNVFIRNSLSSATKILRKSGSLSDSLTNMTVPRRIPEATNSKTTTTTQPNQTSLTSLEESFTDIETEYKYYPWAPGSFQLVVDGKIFIFVTILRIPYLSERI